ncbi:hypothetical protein R1flu_014519 [Riccia fluitans]|uniref:Uncharacterized protein n=1 Tax=Riccia fluitans TaxID=41844 RepID=A0ABD1YGK7_9MARC
MAHNRSPQLWHDYVVSGRGEAEGLPQSSVWVEVLTAGWVSGTATGYEEVEGEAVGFYSVSYPGREDCFLPYRRKDFGIDAIIAYGSLAGWFTGFVPLECAGGPGELCAWDAIFDRRKFRQEKIS